MRERGVDAGSNGIRRRFSPNRGGGKTARTRDPALCRIIAALFVPSGCPAVVKPLPRLKLRGLMTIPEPAPDFEAALAVHRRARALFDELNADGLALDTLSMGMSADLEAAIAAGSTLVRVGTAIFGARAVK